MMRHGSMPAMIAGLCLLAGSAFADGEHLDRIRATGEVRVCIWPEYYAITFRDPRTGTLSGIDIDLAHALASQMNARVRFVDSTFAKLVENLTTDRCDIAMHAVGVRPDRAASMDFSDPYLISGIYAIGSKSNASITTWSDIDQPGHVVAVQKGTYMEPVMRAGLRKATLTVVDNFLERQREVESGRADVFMTDYPYGQRMLAMTAWARLIEPPEPFSPTPYAYAVPKGDPDWLARVNLFVRTVKADGRLRRFAERYGLDRILAP
ncbi:ABC transporter substrate-binding protein [Telmatospirillum sp.]|uniref:substrate-binding periplasmic protein n=1 Tax=Telmatospirillum sp. TaxID=2079197 RepID=UPI00284DC366|nr:ABC transporter substrate-binding protein [Telmatospirillum sp.]MDR3436504.1 ABC transporter substrate-binding protein [Telmatospirillum sp.]